MSAIPVFMLSVWGGNILNTRTVNCSDYSWEADNNKKPVSGISQRFLCGWKFDVPAHSAGQQSKLAEVWSRQGVAWRLTGNSTERRASEKSVISRQSEHDTMTQQFDIKSIQELNWIAWNVSSCQVEQTLTDCNCLDSSVTFKRLLRKQNRDEQLIFLPFS